MMIGGQRRTMIGAEATGGETVGAGTTGAVAAAKGFAQAPSSAATIAIEASRMTQDVFGTSRPQYMTRLREGGSASREPVWYDALQPTRRGFLSVSPCRLSRNPLG
jgi:hypothetical protein